MELTRTIVASCDKSTLGSLHQQPVRTTRLRLHPRAIAICEILLQPQWNQRRDGHRCELVESCIRFAIVFEACCVSGLLHSLLLVIEITCGDILCSQLARPFKTWIHNYRMWATSTSSEVLAVNKAPVIRSTDLSFRETKHLCGADTGASLINNRDKINNIYILLTA